MFRRCTEIFTQPITVAWLLRMFGSSVEGEVVIHVAGAREEVRGFELDSDDDPNHPYFSSQPLGMPGFEAYGGDEKWDMLAKAFLNTSSRFRIFLIGPEMDSKPPVMSQSYEGRIVIHRAQGTYEEFLPKQAKLPDLVRCQNSGVHVSWKSWKPALRVIMQKELLVALTVFDEPEWEQTLITLYDRGRLRPRVLYAGKNPFGSIDYKHPRQGGAPAQVSSSNQWLIVFMGGRETPGGTEY